MKLLIVENDLPLQETLSLALRDEGCKLEYASTAAEAESLIQHTAFSLIILDLSLPDKDGAVLLKQWRRQGIACQVLILTNSGELLERVNGLDAGADDYLDKPFLTSELAARVQALIRRRPEPDDNVLQQDDLRINLQTRQVTLQNIAVEVTPKEFALLTRLMKENGQTVHREALQQDIYRWQDDLSSNSLEVHIHHLRRKLGRTRIKTVRGIGYRLESGKPARR